VTSALHKNFTGTRLRLHTWNHSHSYSGNTMSKAFSFRFTVETTWGRERERMVDSQSDIGNRGTDPVGVQAPNQATTHQPGFMKITGLHNLLSLTRLTSYGIPLQLRQIQWEYRRAPRNPDKLASAGKWSRAMPKRLQQVLQNVRWSSQENAQRKSGITETNWNKSQGPSVRNPDRASSSTLCGRVLSQPTSRWAQILTPALQVRDIWCHE
jgi:hypothetical protein